MSIFRKYESCRGLLLYRFGRFTAELWYCPAGYKIAEHSHPDENIGLMYLFGSTTFYRRGPLGFEQAFKPRWYHFGRTFGVPAGWAHRFQVTTWPLVFINFAKWKAGVKPTSASVDFQLTK